MSINTKMTALADEIRILSGTSDAMGLDAMKNNVADANSEVNEQTDLIAQIQTALEGKAAGGNENIETAIVEFTVGADAYATIIQNGEIANIYTKKAIGFLIDNVVINSIMCINLRHSFNGIWIEGGSILYTIDDEWIIISIDEPDVLIDINSPAEDPF